VGVCQFAFSPVAVAYLPTQAKPCKHTEKSGMGGRVEKIFEVVCWITLGVLGLFMVAWALIRGLGSLVALVLLFVQSPLPWWILAPAAIAVAGGFVYLFKRRRTRIPPNRKFVN
jgi:hypothetical protein